MAFKVSSLFFWWDEVLKIVWIPFWWVVLMAFILFVPFLRVWWWVFLPLFLSMELRILFMWWINWDSGASGSYAAVKWIVLEIVPPKEVLIPIKAMEDVFSVIWPTLYDAPRWRERWCEGILDYAPSWMSWEIVSLEGKIHFYVRINSNHRTAIETTLYSYYPDLEIHEVPDYTKLVPQSLPNEDWDTYGEDFVTLKPAPLPIKTYEKFFEPKGEMISAEEKRIDPMASLMELMSRIGPGENYWIQFVISSVADNDEPQWKKEGQKIIDKIAKRPEKKEITFVQDLFHTFGQIIFGPSKEGSGEKATYKWTDIAVSEESDREMVLTPGEKEIITEIETKMKKSVFKVTMRGVYVAKRENWKGANRVLLRSYMAHFGTQNLNAIGFTTVTRPKVHYLWRKRRVFFRARRMFRNYVLRLPPLFPERRSLNPILNTEEMATLFHFPIKISGQVAPTAPRVESKKAGPPPNLPTE